MLYWNSGKSRTVRRYGWIPVFGQYKPQIEGFPYNPEADHFTCSQGKHLPFKTFDKNADGGWLKVYRADYQDCKQCPLWRAFSQLRRQTMVENPIRQFRR